MRLQAERGDGGIAAQDPAEIPAHALGDDFVRDAQALEDVQRALGPDHAARGQPAHAHGVVIVQDHDADAASRQVERRTEAAEPAADHDDRVRRVLGAVELAGAFVGIDGKF